MRYVIIVTAVGADLATHVIGENNDRTSYQ